MTSNQESDILSKKLPKSPQGSANKHLQQSTAATVKFLQHGSLATSLTPHQAAPQIPTFRYRSSFLLISLLLRILLATTSDDFLDCSIIACTGGQKTALRLCSELTHEVNH